MSKRLFCGGLAWATTTEDLQEAFAPFGEVTDAKVVERRTGSLQKLSKERTR